MPATRAATARSRSLAVSSRTARALCATSYRGQSADSFTETLGASSNERPLCAEPPTAAIAAE